LFEGYSSTCFFWVQELGAWKDFCFVRLKWWNKHIRFLKFVNLVLIFASDLALFFSLLYVTWSANSTWNLLALWDSSLVLLDSMEWLSKWVLEWYWGYGKTCSITGLHDNFKGHWSFLVSLVQIFEVVYLLLQIIIFGMQVLLK
jgi:hypothetical protein